MCIRDRLSTGTLYWHLVSYVLDKLHYEIRDSYDNVLNPLNFSFKEVKDKVNPIINTLSFKTLDIHSRINGKFGVVDIPINNKNEININLEGKIGISISGYDRLDGYLNKVGISRFQLFLDDKLIIDNKIDTLSLSLIHI